MVGLILALTAGSFALATPPSGASPIISIQPIIDLLPPNPLLLIQPIILIPPQPSSPGSGSGVVLNVAKTGANVGNCVAAPCLTITYALSQAPAGATINVGPGTYAEQVVISKPVTINGSGPASTVIEPNSLVLSDTDDPLGFGVHQLPIVDVLDTTGVSLNGFGVSGQAAIPTLDHNSLGCNQSPLGIYFHNSSGSIGNVDVNDIELPADLFGCQGGQGVYVVSAPGQLANVGMDAVTVTNYDKNGITCDDVGTSCFIENSLTKGVGPSPIIAQNGIQALWSTAKIVNDTVLNNSYSGNGGIFPASGILIFDTGPVTVTNDIVANNDVNVFAGEDGGLASGEPIPNPAPGIWTITDNDIANAVNNGPFPFGDTYGDGIQVVSTANPVNIAGNIITGAAEFGVGLYGTSNSTVWENSVSRAVDGVWVGGPGYVTTNSTNNGVNANAISSNSVDGILADTDSANNAFILNLVSSSGHADVVNRGTGNFFLLTLGAPPVLTDLFGTVVVTLHRLLPIL